MCLMEEVEIVFSFLCFSLLFAFKKQEIRRGEFKDIIMVFLDVLHIAARKLKWAGLYLNDYFSGFKKTVTRCISRSSNQLLLAVELIH